MKEFVKKKENIDKMKKIWSEHEKDVQSHIQLICNNHVIKYIGQSFPIQEIKPDNCIEIMDQLIILMRKVREVIQQVIFKIH